MEDKIKIYVHSLKGISPLDYVDTESMGHPCVTSRHGEDIFSRYQYYLGSGCGDLPESQRRIVDITVEFCKVNNLEYEVVDIADLSFLSKMGLLFKRIRAPTVSFKGKKIEGSLKQEMLEHLIVE